MRKPWALVVLTLCLSSLFLPACSRKQPPPAAPAAPAAPGLPRPAYAGSQACAGCHKKRFEDFAKTAHFLTSQEGRADTIHGSFEEGHNVLKTSNPRLWFEMHREKDGFYQDTLVAAGDWYRRMRSERIDIVTGSGKKGQTFLTWEGNRLYEMSISYMSPFGWVNSPGYPDGVIMEYRRPVGTGCLDCHATYFQLLPDAGGVRGTNNAYVRSGYVLGVGCERCHGPGLRHIEYHKAHPDEDHAKFIINPHELPVERRNDLCAQCHADQGLLVRPAFSYLPGEPLSAYRTHVQSEEEQNEPGAHAANQPARLHLSKCFRNSPTMSCITCHNPHVVERGQVALFSKRCLGCHKPEKCPLQKKLGARIEQDCIDCHMRVGGDKKNASFGPGDAMLMSPQRDHHIAIYPDLTKKFLAGSH